VKGGRSPLTVAESQSLPAAYAIATDGIARSPPPPFEIVKDCVTGSAPASTAVNEREVSDRASEGAPSGPLPPPLHAARQAAAASAAVRELRATSAR
jgi:hypothetical protein